MKRMETLGQGDGRGQTLTATLLESLCCLNLHSLLGTPFFGCCNLCTSSRSCSTELPWAMSFPRVKAPFEPAQSPNWAHPLAEWVGNSALLPRVCSWGDRYCTTGLTWIHQFCCCKLAELPLLCHCPVGMNNKLQFAYFQQFSHQLGCILLFCTPCEVVFFF